MTTTQAATKRQKRIEEIDGLIADYVAEGRMYGSQEVRALNSERRDLLAEGQAEEEAARRDARTVKDIVDESLGLLP